MKDYLKYGSYVTVALIIAYVCATLRDCGGVGETSDSLAVAPDSAFSPIVRNEYRPPSTPFEKKRKKPADKLPTGVKERDIKRVITLQGNNTLRVIELNTGEVLVPKEPGFEDFTFTVTDYLPPVVEFGLFSGIGISYSGNVSPAAAVSFSKILGSTYFPVGIADLQGIGVGLSSQVYHNFHLGGSVMWKYSDASKVIGIHLVYYF